MKCVLLVFFGLLIASTARSTQEARPPRLDARLSVVVPDTIELNVPFEVVFTFRANVPVYVDEQRPNRARVFKYGPARLMSGDTLWTGHLKVGEPAVLRATYVIESPSECGFSGRLSTLGPETLDSLHAAYVGKMLWENWAFSRTIELSDSGISAVTPARQATDFDLSPGDFLSPLSQLRTKVIELTCMPRSTLADEIAWPVLHSQVQSPPVFILLTSSPIDTISVDYWAGRIYVFGALYARDSAMVTLVSGDAKFERFDDRSGHFVMDSEQAGFLVTIGNLKRTLVLTRPKPR
jgi:hypothetical protein